uniref:Pr6Pr family membrane protein n=1 Tax=Gordonia sp. B7-2 TaxID=3420932 RepID=UPI003D945466
MAAPTPAAPLSVDRSQTWWARVLRLGFAALGLTALILLPIESWDNPGFTLADYFSYFTILSNVAAVIVLLVGAIAAPAGAGWQWLRGAVTTAMVITGIVYALLLANVDVNLNIEWINGVLHRTMPIVLLVDWIVFRPRFLPDRSWLTWLALPLVYGVYTLIRGPFVDWYPYPFIDPRGQGYLSMTLSLIVVFAGMALMAFGVYWLGARSPTPAPPHGNRG